MEPTRDFQVTLVDLLDRLLDKGLVLNTDLIIHIAGIPLLGLNLKVCLAGIETMLKYGMWNDWDEAQRAIATEERRKKKGIPLDEAEKVNLQVFASHWYSKGIYQAWRPGNLYLTNKRIFLFRTEPAEILFSLGYEEIVNISIDRGKNVSGEEASFLCLLSHSDELIRIHT
ncbi:MAG: gas vesicle protein, partial [Syntrophomonas sp.]|nr:gas vesicle protein [Syntrophomonas sp.]